MGKHYEIELDQCVRVINPVINSSNLTVEQKIAWRRMVILLQRLALTTAQLEDEKSAEQERIEKLKEKKRAKRIAYEEKAQRERFMTITWLMKYETDEDWPHRRIGGKQKRTKPEGGD